MKITSRTFSILISTLTLVPILYAPSVQALNVQQYSRSNSLTFEMLEDARLENSHVYSDFDWIINLGVSYVDEPLVVKTPNNSSQTDTIVPHMKNIHAGVGFYAKRWWQISANINYSYFENNLGQSVEGFGDLEIKNKFRILHDEKYALAIMPTFSLASNSGSTQIQSASTVYGSNSILSDEDFGYGARLIYERVWEKAQVVVNLGYLNNDGARFVDVTGVTQMDYRRRIYSGIGVYYPVLDNVGLNLEYLRAWTEPFFNSNANPTELHLGMSAALSKKTHVFGGVNFGNLISNSDGNDYRLLLGLKFTPQIRQPASIVEDLPAQHTRIVEEKTYLEDPFYLEETNSFTILFDRNNSKLTKHHKHLVHELVKRINSHENSICSIQIIGHASTERFPSNSAGLNLQLGARRAAAVKWQVAESLDEKLKKRINITSRGEQERVEQNSDLEHELNRRVEVIVSMKSPNRSCGNDI